jgi:hypothetical protein
MSQQGTPAGAVKLQASRAWTSVVHSAAAAAMGCRPPPSWLTSLNCRPITPNFAGASFSKVQWLMSKWK